MAGVRICPNCGSENVEAAAGGITGSFMCGECGFSGSVFPEKEIFEEEIRGKKNKLRKGKRKN